MNKLLFILLFVFSVGAKAQQIPNAGFENWSNPKTPDDWFSYSSISIIADLCSQNKTDKFEGNSSAAIKTANISFSTTYEILSLGKGNFSLSTGYKYTPIYFPYRPDTFRFHYQYLSPGVDSASILIKLTKGKTVLLNSLLPLTKTSGWRGYSIQLSQLYLGSETPDSLTIQFQSSKSRPGFFGIDGSTLLIDNLKMGYASSIGKVQSVTKLGEVKLFPNPANQNISIQLNSPLKVANLLFTVPKVNWFTTKI